MYCPSFMSDAPSFINVEKVVKPPQKPVASRSLADAVITQLPFAESPDRNPIIRHPTMFTVNVPSGKAITPHDCIIFDTQ